MTRGRGKGRASITDSMELAAQVHGVPVPSFVKLKPGAHDYWVVLTSAKIASDWRDVDLMNIGKMSNLEVEMQQAQIQLDQTGLVVAGGKGPIANPLIKIIDTMLREYMNLARSSGLGRPAGDLRIPAGQGLVAKQFRNTYDANNDGLLAVPK